MLLYKFHSSISQMYHAMGIIAMCHSDIWAAYEAVLRFADGDCSLR